MAGTVIVDKIQLGDGTSGFQVVSNTGTLIFNANSTGQTSLNGNLDFTGTGRRITGDFSNTTQSNRVLFQTSTANASTRVGVLPSQTGLLAVLEVYSSTDPNNSSSAGLLIGAAETRLFSGITGTGTYLPMTFFTGGSKRAEIGTNGDFSFNSGYGSSAVAYGCRAWVNFNGTGTVAIRASGNVSSITDNTTGDYTVNFTTAMPDINYSPNVSISNDVGFSPQIAAVNNKAAGGFANITPTTSAFRFTVNRASDGNSIDALYALVSVFR